MTEEERSEDNVEPLEDVFTSTDKEDEFSSPYDAHLSED